MAESRLEREQRRLEMNIPYIEENIYVKSLMNRDIPHETSLMTFDGQNITTKLPKIPPSTFDSKNIKTKQPDPRHSKSTKPNSKPNIPPRQCSMKNTYEQVTTDLPPPLPIGKIEHFIPEQTFRFRSPPTPLEELMNYIPDQRDMKRLIEQFTRNETQCYTNCTPQPPILARNEQHHPKLYPAKREQSNFHNDFEHE